MTLSVWRVFNGYIGPGAVHRIVVAFTAEGAIALAVISGMKRTTAMEAEKILESTESGCEAEDFDG